MESKLKKSKEHVISVDKAMEFCYAPDIFYAAAVIEEKTYIGKGDTGVIVKTMLDSKS